jgi:hypothetical protein
MGRLALVLLLTSVAHAAPPLSLQLGFSGGAQWAERSGWVRDDSVLALRGGMGIGDFVALDVSLAEDLERIEPSFGVGARVRPWAGACWAARFAPYLRAEVAVVGASHLASNYDLLAGVGHWGRLGATLAWFAELDVVARVGEYDAVSARIEAGLAIATASFWP